MRLRHAMELLLRTHTDALRLNRRAFAYEMTSGPGVGKSDLMESYAAQLAATLNLPVGMFVRNTAALTGADVLGFMMPTRTPGGELVSTFSRSPMLPTRATVRIVLPDGTWILEGDADRDDLPPAVKAAIAPGAPGVDAAGVPIHGIVALDEFAQGGDEVKKPLADFMLKGVIGGGRLPIGWRVVAASNRMSDKSGVVRPLMHLVNRRGELTIEASYDDWRTGFVLGLPEHDRPHHMTISFAEQHSNVVFKTATPGDGKPFCSPRSLVMLDRELRAMRSDDDLAANRLPMDDRSRELAASWIGEGDAAQFYTHLKYDDLMPRYADILDDPRAAKCPSTDRMDVGMCIAMMLVEHVKPTDVVPVMSYVGRLHIEMQILFVRRVCERSEPVPGYAARRPDTTASAVMNSMAFAQWMKKHGGLIVAARGA